MHRAWSVVERELRRFRRSPILIVISMVFPLVQLVILGYAMGGNVKHLKVAVVDQDGGVPAVRVRELAGAVAGGANTFDTIQYADQGAALTDLRNGRINGVLTIPPEFSRRVLQKNEPHVALIEDNTDNFVSATLVGQVGSLVTAFNQPSAVPRVSALTRLDVVEVYPYVPYVQYLLPGSIVMSIFMMVMIGGGIIFIDDKARGLHEGYLVTPISKLELVAGFNISGTIKAVMAGISIAIIGSLIAGIPSPLDPMRLLRLTVVIVVTAFALIRADQPDVPDHGARQRPVDAARHLRRPQHAAVLSQRRGLPAAGIPGLDAGHRGDRPVYVCRSRVQEPAAQEHGVRGHRRRSALSAGVLRDRDDGGHAPVQADAVGR